MFETISTDLHARVGHFNLAKGRVLTPTLVPVVDPKNNLISPEELKNEYNFNLIITSAYIYYKRFGHPDDSSKIHDVLNYSGNIMMDSGAYQILVYGDVDITPLDSLDVQAKLGADIGVILDVPISPTDNYDIAQKKVSKTIERVKQSLDFIDSHDNVIWTLPIQGGKYLGLLTSYVNEIKKQNLYEPFGLFALGSVAPLMSQYDYLNLFSMIYTTRSLLPHGIPLHLFGAGHPMIFPFITALGCDIFDSAAYMLFAKEGRYITSTATYKLETLNEFPCNCPICSKWSPKELYNAEKTVMIENLAKHNLYVSNLELNKIRLAIQSGRLWELLELRAKSHPKLYQAFNYIVRNAKASFWEELTPVTKFVGLKIFDDLSLFRPELLRIRKKIDDNYEPKSSRIVILIISGATSPIELFNRNQIDKMLTESATTDIVLFIPFFGPVPIELMETYPFSQFVFSGIISNEKYREIIYRSIDFIIKRGYKDVILKILEPSEECEKYMKDFVVSMKQAHPEINLNAL